MIKKENWILSTLGQKGGRERVNCTDCTNLKMTSFVGQWGWTFVSGEIKYVHCQLKEPKDDRRELRRLSLCRFV